MEQPSNRCSWYIRTGSPCASPRRLVVRWPASSAPPVKRDTAANSRSVRSWARCWKPRARTRPRRLSNVVFMGMGEPLANYGPLMGSVRRLTTDVGMSARHLTVSTVGIVPGIRRLVADGVPVNLAVSLHAANDALRDTLVPINRRYPLASLADACADYVERTGRRLSIEWALIDGVNDRSIDVRELAAFAGPLRAHVNVIPLNPTPGYAVRGSSPAGVRTFCRGLRALGVNATIRETRGIEIDAACGQLAASVKHGSSSATGSGVTVEGVDFPKPRRAPARGLEQPTPHGQVEG